MTEEKSLHKLEDVLLGTANVASSLQSKVGIFALIGFIASGVIASLLYSSDSSLIWNLVKCGIVLLPAFILYFVWLTLGKVVEAPKQISQLTHGDGLANNLQSLGINKPDSIRGLISTIRAIRDEDGLGGISDAIGGLVLLSNPALLLLVFVNTVILLLLIFLAPLVLIF